MKKINFKQLKFILPLVILIPLVLLIYILTTMFGGGSSETIEVKQEGLNTSMPAPNVQNQQSKLASMEGRFGRDSENFQDYDTNFEVSTVKLTEEYMADDLERQAAIAELEASLAASRRNIVAENSYAPREAYSSYDDDYEMELARARRQRSIDSIVNPEKYAPAPVVEDTPAIESEHPELVVKSRSENRDHFNTVTSEADIENSPLIRALIDQTTKATQDSRLRFKLLDDVQVKGITIPKGSYLYGTVSGFSQQRVKANISSIMIGDKFLKVNLSVFDNDGMEGFYVPESAFREFMKDAASGTVSQNININSGYGSGISGESLALQALQNVYSSATNAISNNIRKNRAKIKYSTVVYLINSEDAR